MNILRYGTATLLACLLLTSCGRQKMERARYNLLLLESQNRSDSVFRSDTLQLSLAKYFDHHGTRSERMLAYYLLGRARHDMGEAPSAIDSYQQAADLADTTAANCDYNLLLRIYSQMASLFHLQGLPEEEREALAHAEQNAWKAGDTLLAINSREHLTGSYYLEGKYDDVIRICEWASTEYEKAGYKADAARALFSVIHIYVERGDSAKAIPLLERYETESGCVHEHEAVPGHELYYYEKGAAEMYLGHIDSAETFYRQLLSDNRNYNHLQAGYKGLLSVYERLGRKDSISKFAKLYAAATDSSYKEKATRDVAQANAIYKYDKAKMESQQAREELRRTYYALAIILLLLSASILWILQRMRMRRERMRNALRLENQRYLQLLSEYRTALASISSLTEENSSQKDYYQSLIKKLQTELSSLTGNEMDEANWKETSELTDTPIIAKLHKYAATIHAVTPSEWEEMYHVCHQQYPAFLSHINNFTKHDLTSNEKQICILLLFRFTRSEIGALLDITPQSLTNYCSRINMKLFHITGAKGIEFNIQNMKKKYSGHFTTFV